MTSEALHYWILVLDVENFSTRPDPVQRSLRTAMYDVVHSAFEAAGVPAGEIVWEDRGDGILMLVPPTVAPVRLAGPFVRALDDALREQAVFHSAAHALRIRLALHQGLAERDGHGWSGDAINTAFRLVDAQPLRDVLRAAGSARLAFVVSGQVYDAVVRPGRRGTDPAAYLPLRFTTKHGEAVDSWVTVPGYSAPPGLPGGADAAGGPAPDASGGPAPDAVPAPQAAAAPRGGSTIEVGTVHGDVVGGDKIVHAPGPAR